MPKCILISDESQSDDHDPVIIARFPNGRAIIIDPVDADLFTLNWAIVAKGYVMRSIGIPGTRKTRVITLHRIIMERMLGRPLESKEQVDHINGDKQDNRRKNLRLATISQNHQNSKLRKDNTSGYKGICWIESMGKWRARIGVNKKYIVLGFYDTPELAYEAYCKAAKELHGEFANFG